MPIKCTIFIKQAGESWSGSPLASNRHQTEVTAAKEVKRGTYRNGDFLIQELGVVAHIQLPGISYTNWAHSSSLGQNFHFIQVKSLI